MICHFIKIFFEHNEGQKGTNPKALSNWLNFFSVLYE